MSSIQAAFSNIGVTAVSLVLGAIAAVNSIRSHCSVQLSLRGVFCECGIMARAHFWCVEGLWFETPSCHGIELYISNNVLYDARFESGTQLHVNFCWFLLLHVTSFDMSFSCIQPSLGFSPLSSLKRSGSTSSLSDLKDKTQISINVSILMMHWSVESIESVKLLLAAVSIFNRTIKYLITEIANEHIPH